MPICFEDTGNAKGYYNDAEKYIVIKNDISELQAVKTLIHEMAHQMLHSKENQDPVHPVDRNAMEVEAESVAYTVCQKYGLDTSEYSFGYIEISLLQIGFFFTRYSVEKKFYMACSKCKKCLSR